jgi:hypothetical protein
MPFLHAAYAAGPAREREGDAMTTQLDPSTVAANRALGRRFFVEQDRLRGGPPEARCAPGYTATLGGNPAMDR